MPTRPLSHSERQKQQSRKTYDKAYTAQRCEAHGPDPRGTQRWRRLRELVLSRQALCADPFGVHIQSGRIEPATEVDHIQGVWEAPALASTKGTFGRSATPVTVGYCGEQGAGEVRGGD